MRGAARQAPLSWVDPSEQLDPLAPNQPAQSSYTHTQMLADQQTKAHLELFQKIIQFCKSN